MVDATLAQTKQLIELLVREEDPRNFMQNMLGNWGAVQKIGRGEFTQAEVMIALTHIQNENPYASEKVKATFSYPKGYKPNSVEGQVRTLLNHLPWLDVSHAGELAKSWGRNAKADGLYVIPKPTSMAKRLSIEEPWINFGILTEQGPMTALASQRKFINYRAGELGKDRYRLAESAKSALEKFEAQQPGDLLVFPAQTGKLFAGFSPRNTRWEAEHATAPNQWPLPSYVVGWIVFANSHRLERYEDLVIDCPGDEYRFGGSAEFGCVLCFCFDGDGLSCDGRGAAGPFDGCGSGSGFSR